MTLTQEDDETGWRKASTALKNGQEHQQRNSKNISRGTAKPLPCFTKHQTTHHQTAAELVQVLPHVHMNCRWTRVSFDVAGCDSSMPAVWRLYAPCKAAMVQIRGRAGPLRASNRFLMVSSSVATSGSFGGEAALLLPLLAV